MLTDDWDITHICIAVPELEAAMKRYTAAFGIDWGPIASFSSEHFAVVSTLLDAPNVDGLHAVWARNAGPPLELMHAEPGSPAFAIWGCPDGHEYVHHVCYWVEDLPAESAHLVERGFPVELTLAGGSPTRGFAYHRSPTGLRLELMRSEDKPALAEWLESGTLALDW